MAIVAEGVELKSAIVARDLAVLVGRLRRQFRNVYGDDDLTPTQVSVMSRLHRDGPSVASALANAERVRPQSMAATLAALESEGLIARLPDPADGRRAIVSLTDGGAALVEGRIRFSEGWLAGAVQQNVNPSDLDLVQEALRILLGIVE